VHVPRPLNQDSGHHEIPWSILGWDLRLLGLEDPGISLETHLNETINEAKASESNCIIFSSEDFSHLSLDQWKLLLATVHFVASETDPIQFEVAAVFRDPDQSLFSLYKTLVMLGLPQEFSQVSESLRKHILESHNRLRTLTDSIKDISELVEIRYKPKGLIPLFWTALFPRLEIPEDGLRETKFNAGYDENIVELVRQSNVYSGLNFDSNHLLNWPTFHTIESASSLSERRQKLLTAHSFLLNERDALLNERDSLLDSTSWRVTTPLRYIRRISGL